jgi:hypothetical protein
VVKDGDPKALVIRTASGAQDRVRIVIELSNLAVLVTELLKRAPPLRVDGRVNVSWNDLDRAHVTFPKTKKGDAGVPLASACSGSAELIEAPGWRSLPPAGGQALQPPRPSAPVLPVST